MKSRQLLNENNFIRLILVGLGLSLLALIAYEMLSIIYIPVESLKAAISLASLAYITFILKESVLKVGKVTVFFFLGGAQLILLLAIMPLDVIIGSNLLTIWLVRTFYLHRNLVDSIGDIGFLVAGLAASLWSLSESNSLLLGFWSFFLIQALLVFLPKLTTSFKGGNLTRENAKNSGVTVSSSGSDSVEQHVSKFEQAFSKAKKRLKETRVQSTQV